METLFTKQQQLHQILYHSAPLAIAFSGGVDSSLLLKVAYDLLGEQCQALTVDAPYHFRQELTDATALTRQLGIHHTILSFDPFSIPNLMNNPPERCYLCKRALLMICRTALPSTAWTLADGSTQDDQTAYRPGRKALEELAVRSPLAEAGFTKTDVRELSRSLGLPTWDKPAQSCLLTRFLHDQPISNSDLTQVEVCETALKELGFKVVRLRSIKGIARLETEEGELATAKFPTIEAICRTAGFSKLEIDPAGYRCGSMDQN